MAVKTWATPGTSGNWNVDANWGPLPGVPAATDDVTIGGSATAFTVTLDIATTGALDSLTLGDGVNGNVILSLGANALDVSGAGVGATNDILLQGAGGSTITVQGGSITADLMVIAAGGVAGF